MKYKDKGFSGIWIRFLVVIFFVINVLILEFGATMYVVYKILGITNTKVSWILMTVFILLTSLFLATGLALFVEHRILRPVVAFGKATKKVADGDFSVRMEEGSQIKGVDEMSRNFNIMVTELAGIETLRNDFIANVSHEFKTPLSAIEGYATLLQNPNLSKEEQEEYGSLLINSSKQLSKLVDNILKLSKLENQEVMLDKTKFRLDEQLRKTVLLFEKDWVQKDIMFDLDLPSCEYYGNQDIIRQIWTNIIGNAIKYSNTGSSISVNIEKNVSFVRVCIIDEGIGMSDIIKEHVFEKFYQGDTTRKSEGNGLGLAIVNRIVRLLEGAISIESEIDIGTKVMVSLPIEVIK